MNINGRNIGEESEPYIIAELSANHGGSIGRAKKSIYEAAKSGVDAIKIQSYTPDTMTIKCMKPDFQISEGLWAGTDLYDLYSMAHTPFEWHKELFNYAEEVGITLFSTPFDKTAVDLLQDLNTPAYKIASFEIIDLPLVEYIAKTNKPIFLSTGMASIDEIDDAIATIRKFNTNDLLLFHCISSYPAPTSESNLRNITFLSKKYDVRIGLSDHTISNIAATVAVGMGAVAIEKHFKLDERDCGPDSSFSLNIKQLTSLVNDCREAWQAKGQSKFGRSEVESSNVVFRRSLYFVKDLSKGQIIGETDIRVIRPGYGLKPKHINSVIGKSVSVDVERGDPVKWNILV